MHRFILSNRTAIEHTPLQAYTSALIFSPVHSLTRELFRDEEPNWIIIKPVVDAGWGACLQTLEGHGSSINSVNFSADGTRVASGSYESTIKIWDTNSGTCLQTLESYGGRTAGTAFVTDKPQCHDYGLSHDGTWITWQNQDVLWLPLEYRPSSSAFAPWAVVIGSAIGRVLIMKFSLDKRPA